jgi:hypothetical protein
MATVKIHFPDEETLGDTMHRYVVITQEGITFEIDNRNFFTLTENTTNERNLMDFNSHVGILTSLINYYAEMENKSKTALDDYENEKYMSVKAMPKYKAYGRALGGAEDNKEPSDRYVASVIKSSKEYRELRNSFQEISNVLMRLNGSLSIAKSSWETARSLNSNARSLLGVG